MTNIIKIRERRPTDLEIKDLAGLVLAEQRGVELLIETFRRTANEVHRRCGPGVLEAEIKMLKEHLLK